MGRNGEFVAGMGGRRPCGLPVSVLLDRSSSSPGADPQTQVRSRDRSQDMHDRAGSMDPGRGFVESDLRGLQLYVGLTHVARHA